MFNEQEIRAIAQKVVDENNTTDQFAVSQVPFHTHNKSDSPAVSFPNLTNRSRFIVYRVVAPATSNTVAAQGGNFVMPFSGNFVTLSAFVDTAGTTGAQTMDVQLNGTTILINTSGAGLAIPSGATASNTQTFFAINSFNIGDILTFSVTAIQSTPAMGLTFQLRVTETSQ